MNNLIDYQQLAADREFNSEINKFPIQQLKLNHLNWELIDLLINGNCAIPKINTMTHCDTQYTQRQ